jgi:hypothetical protein
MYQVANIKASITESQGLYNEPQGVETNGQWSKVAENYYSDVFVAAYGGNLYKAQNEECSTPIDYIFPDPTWLTVAVVDRGYIRMSNKGDMRHIEDLVDDETLQAGLEGDEIAVFYQGPQGWYRSQGIEDAADKLFSRNDVVIFISDTACSDLAWENYLKDYRAWADGYLWDISRAVDVQLGEHVTHFTISEEALELIEWERVTGSVIFTPDSDGWNEPNIPVQQLI